MDARYFWNKTQRLAEILTFPRGLTLKLSERAFESANFRVCTRLRDSGIAPATVFDVGANAGQFALAARTVLRAAQVHSYEPVERPFARLQRLAARLGGVTPHRSALGRTAGRAVINVATQAQASSLLALHPNHRRFYPEVTDSARQEVVVSTLAIELGQVRCPEPLLLKLDVQGFEGEVLAGAGDELARFRWILLETATDPLYQGQALFDDVTEQLRRSGFRFRFPLDIHFSTQSGAVTQFDALYERCDADRARR
ncbi:MAG: FkbM family methyltransferase [Deltaproteobacteria bacterium]|nr:FkbM family methyltransferase [Deltaproteobacteria bacterium]